MATTVDRAQFQGLFNQMFIVKTTYDAASLATGAGRSDTITVNGVALGDIVLGISLGVSTAGLTITGNVTAANTVTLRLDNLTGGAVDMASTNLFLLIGRPSGKFV